MRPRSIVGGAILEADVSVTVTERVSVCRQTYIKNETSNLHQINFLCILSVTVTRSCMNAPAAWFWLRPVLNDSERQD